MVNENEFLLHALMMGTFITFVYDILRIFRRVFPHKQFVVSLEDIIFWIYCGAEVFLLMHRESNGTLRWFAVLGALTGMLLYMKLVSPFFVKWVSFVLQKLMYFLLKIGNIVLFPFKAAGKKVANAADMTKSKVVHRGRGLKRLIKKKLTFFLKVLKMNL